MPFRFEWKDDSRRVICYIADGDWNWKNYHHAVRASTFTLSAVDHPVECLIDLRGSTRQTMPSGLNAHVRSFGKKAQANLSGRAVVIGMPPQGMASLQLDGENTLLTLMVSSDSWSPPANSRKSCKRGWPIRRAIKHLRAGRQASPAT